MSDGAARTGAPGSVGGPGLLEGDRETATLTFRRLLRHPIEEVWAAITEPDQLGAWFLAKVQREGFRGGRLEMEHPNGVHASGRVLEWSSPRAYEYEWNVPPSRSQPRGETSRVRWELSPADGGTLLVLIHRRLSRPTAEIFARGLSTFLDRLAALLDGRPLPFPPWVTSTPVGRDPV